MAEGPADVTALVAYLVLLLARAVLAGRYARTFPERVADTSRVCVVQPVLGGDPRLREVLADNLAALPAVRFLWLVDEDDPAGQAACREAQAAQPTARVTLRVLPPPPAGVNPKLFKLAAAARETDQPVLVMLDDDTRLPAASLQALVAGLEGHELTTGLPAYLHDGRWPSRLLAQFVNDNAALTYLTLVRVLPPPSINGMTWAVRRETLSRIGGLEALQHHLTDDLAVARAVRAAGGRILQTPRPQWVQTTVRDGRHYVAVMHRWYLFAWLLMKAQPPALALLIGAVHGSGPILLWAALLTSPWRAVAALLLARAVVLPVLQQQVYGRPLHEPLLSIVSELLQPLHLLHALLRRRITWRSRRYEVHSDTDFRPVP
jgi:ceramide glucosyltransferase